MRKLHILAISLLLLFVQQGAVLHEVGHIVRVASTTEARFHADTQLSKTCDLCLAFSQVANPAVNTVAIAAFEPYSCLAVPTPACAATPRDIPTPRSRGPPLTSRTA